MTTTRIVLALAAAATLAATPQAYAQDSWSWSGSVPAGRTIEIKGVNGGIRAVASSDRQVRVTARKTSRRSSTADVRMEVVQHGGGVTVCAVYPSPARRPANECAPGSGGRMSVDNNDVQVQWVVHVPRGVNFMGRTVNGAITGEDLPADAEARTVNGAITLTAAGQASARTVNGAIRANFARADWQGSLDFETVNGAITLTVPATTSAQLSGRTVNGNITSDFPIEVTGRFGPRRVDAALGGGGSRQLNLRTVNGSIALRSR